MLFKLQVNAFLLLEVVRNTFNKLFNKLSTNFKKLKTSI